ncbi:condensin-2 complex subunit D3 [Eurytemora carolleeae]|uniref:condensin-2 complex subunit D3 n=1 Tax=Eurytemora carolleeae TaxID=1294199 RepID=UPI000C76DF36|nr:condensin-2 complex subunit D3 [Eurytemora carolleeae]|eukprot:XP_023339086.1 condensin-2 complex subunit D3-like [Eurytemora affinis]
MLVTMFDLIIQNPEEERLLDSWVIAAFPLVKDVESKISEKIIENLYECIVINVVPLARMKTPLHSLPWSILRAVERHNMELYLAQAVCSWAKEKKISADHINNLQTYLDSEHSVQAWFYLSMLTTYIPCSKPGFVLQYFSTALNSSDLGLSTLLQVSKVLLASVNYLSKEEQKTLKTDLIDLTSSFSLPVEIIPNSVDIITVILKKENKDIKVYHSALESYTVDMLLKIEDFLSEQILKIPTYKHSEKTISRYIATLGELAQLTSSRISKRLFLLIQSVVFFKHGQDEDKENQAEAVFSQEVTCRSGLGLSDLVWVYLIWSRLI